MLHGQYFKDNSAFFWKKPMEYTYIYPTSEIGVLRSNQQISLCLYMTGFTKCFHIQPHFVLKTKRSISIILYMRKQAQSSFLRITQLLKHRAETETWISDFRCSIPSVTPCCFLRVGELGLKSEGFICWSLLLSPPILLDSNLLRNKVFIPVLLLPPSTCLQP